MLTKGGAKIFIAEASIDGNIKKEDSSVTRMKFSVLVEMPNKKKIRKNAGSLTASDLADMIPH